MSKPEILNNLEDRIGQLHLKQRLGIQADHQAKASKKVRGFFYNDTRYSFQSLIRGGLRTMGLHRRGRRNAANLQVNHHNLSIPGLPTPFDGYTILHLSDLHLDINTDLTDILIEQIFRLEYDLCVVTGDFRARSIGCHDAALSEMKRVRSVIHRPTFGVLGNHDFIEMVPELESLGIIMLLNESAELTREDTSLYLAGIDDPHYYQLDNLKKARENIPDNGTSILLSHAPRIYKWAAHAGFDVFLCGHTHGGQVCLPGGKPFAYGGRCPRKLGKGSWMYHRMQGYTSVGSGAAVVDIRFNCLPEITLHHLWSRPSIG